MCIFNFRKKINRMRYFIIVILLVFFKNTSANDGQEKWYLQWGWNREVYTKSTIHFVNSGQYDFYWNKVTAKDKPDFQAIPTLAVTIPQFSFRIGYRISEKWFLELNHDHTKYVVTPGQVIHLTGEIDGKSYDTDTILDNSQFHFEHTNGANFWMLMAARKFTLGEKCQRLSFFAKGGAGIVFPRTDVTLFGKRLNNQFHVAGYIAGIEGNARYQVWRGLYADLGIKTGFANYINALTVEGGKANHSFGFLEGIFSIGYSF